MDWSKLTFRGVAKIGVRSLTGCILVMLAILLITSLITTRLVVTWIGTNPNATAS